MTTPPVYDYSDTISHAIDFIGVLWYLGYGGPPVVWRQKCIHSHKHMRREFRNTGGGQEGMTI